MSTSVDTAFVRQYEAEVKHVFQREGGILRDAVRLKTGVVGSSTTFQKIGKGVATTKARHGQITPMNQDHTALQCTLSDRYAGDWVDKLDETKAQHNEREAISKGGAWACGRAMDSDIFVEMDATTQAGVTFDYTSIATVRNSLINTIKALNANEVPNDGQRYAALTANMWAAAETVAQFTSQDYVLPNGRPFVEGAPFPRWRNFMGAMWTNHQGITGAGASSTVSAHAWHKLALGYALGNDLTADITWHGDRASHFVNHMFSGGAKLIDDLGVIEITATSDTTALPSS